MFVTMMDQETQPIISKLSLKPDYDFNNPFCSCFNGKFKSLDIFLYKPKKDPKFLVESVGSEIAALITYIGINNCHPDLIINAGSSGGIPTITNDLKIGDVCVAKEGIGFFDREMIFKEYQEYQKGKYEIFYPEKIIKSLNLKEGIVGTTSSFTSNSDLACKKNIQIVEMEAASVGKVCYWLGVPFFVMKVVSDVVEVDEIKKAKMFENNLDNVSEILAGKIYDFLDLLNSEFF